MHFISSAADFELKEHSNLLLKNCDSVAPDADGVSAKVTGNIDSESCAAAWDFYSKYQAYMNQYCAVTYSHDYQSKSDWCPYCK